MSFLHRKFRVPLSKRIVNNIMFLKEQTKYNLKIGEYSIKKRVHDGILFEAANEIELDRLINFYESVKSEATTEEEKIFFDNFRESGVKLSTAEYRTVQNKSGINYLKTENGDFCDYRNYMVHFSIETLVLNNKETFFHEIGHVLDYFSNCCATGLNGLKKATEKFSTKTFYNEPNSKDEFELYFQNFIKVYNEKLIEIEEELKKDIHQQKVDELAKQYYSYYTDETDYDSEDFKLYKESIAFCYRNSYIRSTGLNCISDIFDSLSGGDLQSNPFLKGNDINSEPDENGFYSIKPADKTIYFGHGIKYYGGDRLAGIEIKRINGEELDDRDKITIERISFKRSSEIIANVSALVNLGKQDLLYKYFPEDFANSLLEVYQSIKSDVNEKIKNNGKSI